MQSTRRTDAKAKAVEESALTLDAIAAGAFKYIDIAIAPHQKLTRKLDDMSRFDPIAVGYHQASIKRSEASVSDMCAIAKISYIYAQSETVTQARVQSAYGGRSVLILRALFAVALFNGLEFGDVPLEYISNKSSSMRLKHVVEATFSNGQSLHLKGRKFIKSVIDNGLICAGQPSLLDYLPNLIGALGSENVPATLAKLGLLRSKMEELERERLESVAERLREELKAKYASFLHIC